LNLWTRFVEGLNSFLLITNQDKIAIDPNEPNDTNFGKTYCIHRAWVEFVVIRIQT